MNYLEMFIGKELTKEGISKNLRIANIGFNFLIWAYVVALTFILVASTG